MITAELRYHGIIRPGVEMEAILNWPVSEDLIIRNTGGSVNTTFVDSDNVCWLRVTNAKEGWWPLGFKFHYFKRDEEDPFMVYDKSFRAKSYHCHGKNLLYRSRVHKKIPILAFANFEVWFHNELTEFRSDSTDSLYEGIAVMHSYWIMRNWGD